VSDHHGKNKRADDLSKSKLRSSGREFEGLAVETETQRRRFCAGYQLRILSGGKSVQRQSRRFDLLRREGMYSSRNHGQGQREAGCVAALTLTFRGPQPSSAVKRLDEPECETARLHRELAQVQTIISIQREMAELLQSLKSDETGN
jgi:hypothetical protein